MKTFITLIFISFFSISVLAQSLCSTGRYYNSIFNNIQITTDIKYGQNTNNWGFNEDLKLDIYEPTNDTAGLRAFVLLAHGGEFIEGTKNDSDMVVLSRNLAHMGYVVASIDYRKMLSFLSLNGYSAKRAAYHAYHDMKAAIRYIRKDIEENGNPYRIDTNNFYIGGTSAGAITALHVAFMDKYSEVLAHIDTTDIGVMAGNSGNPGYSQSIHGVINLSGALLDADFIEQSNIPIISMHGSIDDVVPYKKGASALINDLVLEGSYEIEYYGLINNLNTSTYSFFNKNHIPYFQDNDTTVYIDTVINFVKNRLYEIIGCNCSDPEPLPNTTIDTCKNIALYKPIYADDTEGNNVAQNANDSLMNTRWSSNFSEPHFLTLDLQNYYQINKIKIHWEYAHAQSYKILFSNDSVTWDTAVVKTNSNGGLDEFSVNNQARYIKLLCLERATEYGFSLYEFEVFGYLSSFFTKTNKTKTNTSIIVYPNPANDYLYVKNIEQKKCKIEIYSIIGKKEHEAYIDNNKISVQNLPSGVYIYKININNQIFKQGKFIKK